MKKKRSLFYRIYFTSIAVFAILLVTAYITLGIFLKNYNKGIPETVSKNFFTENFENINTDNLIKLSGIAPTEFEELEDIKEYIKSELSKDKLSYTSISNQGDSKSKRYIVKSGDFKIATFTLLPDKNNDYHVNSLTLHLTKSSEMTFVIPDTSTLYINEVKVDEKYLLNKEYHKNAKYLPENTKKPKLFTYKISGLTKEPECSIIDKNGNSPALKLENGIYYEDTIYDMQEKEVVDTLTKAAKEYAKCMQNDASKYDVLKYFVKGTDLYSSILSAENMFVWDHSGYDFEDVKISEFTRYDDNTVSCRISFTHVLKKYGKDDYRDYTDITYFAKNTPNGYLIYARYNN